MRGTEPCVPSSFYCTSISRCRRATEAFSLAKWHGNSMLQAKRDPRLSSLGLVIKSVCQVSGSGVDCGMAGVTRNVASWGEVQTKETGDEVLEELRLSRVSYSACWLKLEASQINEIPPILHFPSRFCLPRLILLP